MGLEHMRNLSLMPFTRVVAVADPHAGSRAEAAAVLGHESAASIVEDYCMLRDLAGTIDAFIIATPNYTHIDILRTLIPWKKHILVEKVHKRRPDLSIAI